MSNSTHASTSGCPVHSVLPSDPVPFFSHGNINFKAHDVGWIVAGAFTFVAVVTSAWLIAQHLAFFYAPHTQRHIVRILFLVPIYAICSFLSYYFYSQALYFQLVRDCYEAIVIAAFFFLLIAYLSNPPPTPEQPCPAPYQTRAERTARLREVVKDFHLKKWMWPFGWVKWRPAKGGKGEGEAFLWIMRIGIGQYVLVRPLSTLVAVVSEYLGWYCLASWSPKFTHIYTSAAITISVSVAMYNVLQLYMAFKKELAPFSPVLKFLAVKSVVFLTFWQESGLSLLETMGVIKDKEYWTAGSIVIGISALLSCFEMMLFGFLHLKAFSYLPYRALAAPVRVPAADSDTLSLSSNSSDPMPTGKSFAEWNAWEQRKERKLKAASRLAKTKLKPGDLAIKEDGTPLLQRTKRLPALWKCLLLTDLGRELKEETGHLVRRREDGLLDRRDDLEEVMGKTRATGNGRFAEKDWGIEDDGYGDGRGVSLEKDLRRLRQGKEIPSGRSKAKVGPDGSLLLPTLSKYGNAPQEEPFDIPHRLSREEEGQSLLRAEEGRVERWEQGLQQRKKAGDGRERWWSSLSKSLGTNKFKKETPSSFAQLERPDDRHLSPSNYDPDPTTAPRAPPRITSHSSTHHPAASYRPTAPPRPLELSLPEPLALPDELPLESMASMGPLTAPHALGSPTRTYAPSAAARPPSSTSRRHSAEPRLNGSAPSLPSSLNFSTRQPSIFAPEASGLRHPSMVAATPSTRPPHRPSLSWQARAGPPLTEFRPPPRAWRRHSTQLDQAEVQSESERSLQLLATEESRKSRGLPPGAGRPMGGGGRGFVIEEY
ncbi:organic solute transporter Ostalpha-domain-containing protein [Leucosporidium creatinivorum]|uniref:Organic solute transporter Ostalpha-domain-containing protein n=1 Tax=Leucosporidium creatinivorum TaxID=106004 RepID=A0A1Y2FZ12_9BASI|nr:organic solute transporter Ostalpha-domain-containing protein [Leucosporidium creatinivorum]